MRITIIDKTDLKVIKQNAQHLYIKLQLSNMFDSNGKLITDYKTIASVSGDIVDGEYSCDSSSDIRHTLSLTMNVNADSTNITNNKGMWMNKFIKASLGLFYVPEKVIKWYKLGGIYVIQNGSYSYSASDNKLSLSCSDLITILNGDRLGYIPGNNSIKIEGAPTCHKASISFDNTNKIANIDVNFPDLNIGISNKTPLYPNGMIGFKLPDFDKEKEKNVYKVKIGINKNIKFLMYDSSYKEITFDTFEPKGSYCFQSNGDSTFLYKGKPNTIRGAMIDILKTSGISKHNIGRIGSEQSTTSANPYPYRVPYDLTFSTGSTYFDVIKKLRDLYSGWEAYFDNDGTFICEEIPTCENDPCILTYSDIYDLVISENENTDLTNIYNVTEVWGKSIEANHYCEKPTIKCNNSYTYIDLDIKSYAIDDTGKSERTYEADSIVGFTMPILSSSAYSKYGDSKVKVRITNAEEPLMYYDLVEDLSTKENVTLNMLKGDTGYCWHIGDKNNYAVFNGQFQVHAVNILCNTKPTAKKIKQDKIDYNCCKITYTYDAKKKNKFAIENCGKIVQVLSGNDYEKIYTEDLARQRAEYETWKSARFTDTLSITTSLIPFLDVNKKIRYKSIKTGEVNDYLINKVSFSFSDFKSTIEMRKFYPEYPYIIKK